MKFSAVITLGLILLFGFAPIAFAQAPYQLPLSLDNNYMVTGDYVVGGWTKGPSIAINGMSNGTINIPDPIAYGGANLEQKVPVGADIVAAFLYWGIVENSGVHSGQNGFFNNGSFNYPISGTLLGNPNAPVSWSSGGCAGAANGSKTMVMYRAEVSALLPVDANGNVQPNTSYTVSLPDTGKAGQPPYALGATLVIVYRLLAPNVPLNAVIIYDGAYAPSNTAQTTTQPMIGFYQAGNDQAAPIVTKITHIVGNGQSNKLQQVFLNNYDAQGKLVHSTLLPSLYGSYPPFPGNNYNTPWDNPTWFPNSVTGQTLVYPSNYPNTTTPAVKAGESSETTVVVPNGSNKGCVSWGAIVMSTTVQDTDHDGLLDVWKTNLGYYDAGSNRGMSNQGTSSWVSLPEAHTPGQSNQDVYIQLDYMCTKVIVANGNTTCDPSGVSYKPDPLAISSLATAFSSKNHNIYVHVIPDDNNVILAQCADTVDANGNPVYCAHPGQAGVVDWKVGFTALKVQPTNYPDETTCEKAGSLCVRRFPPGQNNSYHEAIFAVASATPDWYFQDGSLTSISASGNTLTFTTSAQHGLAPDPTNTGIPNGRITIYGAISNPSLNGTYLVHSVPTTTSFTIQLATATAAPTKATDPFLSVGSSVVSTGSGVSDIGGADSLISLGLWGADGQTVPVESGTFMHELGHSLGLTHGGLYRTDLGGGNYSFSFEPNCKSNFQSVMNYMFQVDLLDGVLDYSEQVLGTLNESAASPQYVLASAIHPTTEWYAPNQAFGSPATAHCDGSPLLPADQPTFRLQGPATSITWAANQDINFDGKTEAALQGYDDWTNILLDQVGATGNDLWAAGVPGVRTIGGVPSVRTIGGVPSVRTIGGEAKLKDVSSFVRNPTGASATLTPANTVNVNFTAPGFGQSQIASFNIYRAINGAAFSKPAYDNLPVTKLPPLPWLTPLTYTDNNVGCGVTYSYFVTTVLSDGRESVQSNTTQPPISVQCQFVGLLSPLSTASQAPAAPTFSGSRNLGNAAPVKWELLGANNQPISDLTTLKLMQACSTTGPTSAPGPGSLCVPIYSPLGTEGSTTFRYSAPNFVVNWDTGPSSGLTHGYWTLELELSDGRTEWTNILF